MNEAKAGFNVTFPALLDPGWEERQALKPRTGRVPVFIPLWARLSG